MVVFLSLCQTLEMIVHISNSEVQSAVVKSSLYWCLKWWHVYKILSDVEYSLSFSSKLIWSKERKVLLNCMSLNGALSLDNQKTTGNRCSELCILPEILICILSWICSHFHEIHLGLFVFSDQRDHFWKNLFFSFVFVFCFI